MVLIFALSKTASHCILLTMTQPYLRLSHSLAARDGTEYRLKTGHFQAQRLLVIQQGGRAKNVAENVAGDPEGCLGAASWLVFWLRESWNARDKRTGRFAAAPD